MRWSQVQELGLTSVGLSRVVACNFKPDDPASKRGRALSKALSGYEAALPDPYGLKALELAELLEGLQQRSGETARS